MEKPHLPPADFREITLTGLQKKLARESWGFISLGIRKLWEEKKVKGKNIKVAVLDTGPPKHKDIKVFKDINFTKDDKEDGNGHSTWVCGTINAEGGLLGIAPRCQLHAAKVLNNDGGGEWDWLYKGIEWAYQEGCTVINISAGGDAPDSIRRKTESLLKEMAAHNVLVVCAAGNEKNIHIYPANSMYTICVGAVNRQIEKAVFSNFGPRMLMMAPGVNLIGCWLNNSYAKGTGTSMSSPFGTGVLTLAKGLRDLSLTEAIIWLALTSKDLQKPGWDPPTGFGYLQPRELLKFTVGERKWTWAWIINVAMFLFMYRYGDEEYRTQLRRVLWPKRF